jgi:hypothetical protein
MEVGSMAVIRSPFGYGDVFIGDWDYAWSPKEMMRANPNSHGFRILGDAEWAELEEEWGDLLPRWPGEWCILSQDARDN